MQPLEGYHNYNAMGGKDKTFVPHVPIPKFRTKKQRKAAKLLKEQGETDVMKDGVVAGGESEWPTAKPGGGGGGGGGVQKQVRPAESPFADQPNPLENKVVMEKEKVNSPETDPEAFDDMGEIGWKQTKWEDVKVGDFIKIYDNQALPAGE